MDVSGNFEMGSFSGVAGQNPAGADSKENSRDEIGESRNCFKNFFFYCKYMERNEAIAARGM